MTIIPKWLKDKKLIEEYLKLTSKQQVFIQRYIINFNARLAAEEAKYSKKTSKQIGEQNLSKLARFINCYKAYQKTESEITVEYVVNSLRTVAERCMGDKLDSSGANRSLELLGRHTGAFEKDNLQKKTDIEIILEQIAEKAENAIRGLEQ
uniref:Putative terminase n=1 Tax=viral metagenome TaxID=1070528 RepID=A0A6H1ZT72_9ZZZZ